MLARWTLLLLASLSGAAPTSRLDIDLYAKTTTPVTAKRGEWTLPLELWRPGSPLNARGESPWIPNAGYTANVAIAAAGLAQSVSGFGKDKEATATSVGFGIVAVLNAWRLWHGMSEQRPRPASR